MVNEERDAEKSLANCRMREAATLLLLVIVTILFLTFFATFGNDGTILVGCSNVAQTRGGTICLDRAYLR